MKIHSRCLAAALVGLVGAFELLAQSTNNPAGWRILIANDTCPDVTWGFTYDQTRQALADLVCAHLDEMERTDAETPENRSHYNMAAAFEAECFIERYPKRKLELIQRIRQGRICVSPFLCNSLWGFQSVEGAIRTFYPARRLERNYGISIDVAEHIELPSLPWGMASIMSGCGVRWTSVPFLNYDSTFKELRNPPLFRLEGPDGSEVRVVMDTWASMKANYSQGAYLLKDPKRIIEEWIPHYETCGPAYPLRAIFASGTHSDINPNSGKQARGFADGIVQYNAAGTNRVTLVNGTLAQFCQEVDAQEQQSPFLPKLRGCFGHSWELWPVCLAHTAASLREHERAFLAAESLVALAGQSHPVIGEQTRADREKAEWLWAMLSDHAWNGTGLANKRHNAQLRRQWSDGLGQISRDLTRLAWLRLGLRTNHAWLTVFNPLSFKNNALVVYDAPPDALGVCLNNKPVPAQRIQIDGRPQIVFVAPQLPAFGFREFHLETQPPKRFYANRGLQTHTTMKSKDPLAANFHDGSLNEIIPIESPFRVTDTEINGPFYRLQVNPRNGGLRSLVHQPSNQELLNSAAGYTLCQSVFFDGQERVMSNVMSKIIANGPVLARIRITGDLGALHVTNDVTLYSMLDHVDFEVNIEKPISTNEQRLLHFFPIADSAQDLRIETTASVLRPRLQPDGDLLPGADTRRFAVQGFVDYSPAGRVGVTIAPLDAFMIRLDQNALAFEALGNDQNWKEVVQDQDGATHFRFRYRLRAHAPGYNNAVALAWSRSATAPSIFAQGRLPQKWLDRRHLDLDPGRALALCLKPADENPLNQVVVRLWETSGCNDPVNILIPGCHQVQETDLLERERGPLSLRKNRVSVPVRGYGFSAIKLQR